MIELILTAYLITRYTTDEGLAGPFGLLDRWRKFVSRWQVSAEIFACPFCTAFWAGVLALLLSQIPYAGGYIVMALAAAGGVAMFYTVANELSEFVGWVGEYVDSQTANENEMEIN